MQTAYEKLADIKDISLFARVVSKFTSSLFGKKKCQTAFLGSTALGNMEVFCDSGFWLKDLRNAFFGEDCKSWLDLYQPLKQFDAKQFDVALVSESDPEKKIRLKTHLDRQKILFFDLDEIVFHFRSALQTIQPKNFVSCLNINKLATVTLLTYLCPDDKNIAEIGTYQCGTTLFMAKLLQQMKKNSKIFAFDTFSGIPAPTKQDKMGKACFEKGMFSNTSLSQVQQLLIDEKVEQQIDLYPGLIEETLSSALTNRWNLFFAFVDTDQYQSTKLSLEQVLNAPDKPKFIIVGDTLVPGVDRAIKKMIHNRPSLQRTRFFMNFDLIHKQREKLDPSQESYKLF